jgi:hypothetical protein
VFRSSRLAAASVILATLVTTPAAPAPAAPAPAAPAAANTVTVEFVARVETVRNPSGLCAAVAPGDRIAGRYRYTLGVQDSNEGDFVGDYAYPAPPNGIQLRIGGQVTGSDPADTSFLLEVVNDFPGNGSDSYVIHSFNNLPLTCGSPVDHISWQLDDPTGTALSSTALPSRPPRLADWTSLLGLTISGGNLPGVYAIRAHVTAVRRV